MPTKGDAMSKQVLAAVKTIKSEALVKILERPVGLGIRLAAQSALVARALRGEAR